MSLIIDQKFERLSREIQIDKDTIGIVTSQCWSPRYRKRLAFAMMNRDYLQQHSTVEIDGVETKICSLPFSDEDLQEPTD